MPVNDTAAQSKDANYFFGLYPHDGYQTNAAFVPTLVGYPYSELSESVR